MTNSALSRRSFSKLIGASAAYAAFRPVEVNASWPAANIVRLSSNENPYGPSPAALRSSSSSSTLYRKETV